MERIKMTAKGQVTIPVEVRRRLDLGPGEELLLEADEAEGRLVLRRRKSPADFYRATPATRSFPGRNVVRLETAARLARRSLQRTGTE